MRFLRIVLGLLLALVGLVVTLLGAVAAFAVVGPDDTVDTGQQRLSSDGLAVMTAPDMLDRHGPTLKVHASSAKPVFVGIGQDLDVASYLEGSQHTRVTQLTLPPKFGTQEVKGERERLNPPTGLEWWTVKSHGSGERAVAWTIDEGRYDVVVMNADGTPGVDAQVTFGLELKGLFGTCLLVFGVGVVLLVGGLLLAFLRRRRSEPPTAPRQPVEEHSIPPYQVAQLQANQAQGQPGPQPGQGQPGPYQGGQGHPGPYQGQPGPYQGQPVPQQGQPGPYQGQPVPQQGQPGPYQGQPGPYQRQPGPYQGGQGQPGPYQGHGQQGPVRRVITGLTAGALLLVATGCVAVPEKNTKLAAASTRPAVTVADGQALMKKYTDANNKANQTRDAKLAATVEAPPLLTQTEAGYIVDRKIDPTGKDKAKPFTFTKPKIGAPTYGSYPMRFVGSSGVSSSTESQQIGVWERKNAGAPWLMTHSVYPRSEMKLPALDGLRVPAKADLGKLSSLPQSAGSNLAEYLTGGAASPKAGLFTPSQGTLELINTRAKSKVEDVKETYISSAHDNFRLSGDPVMFITGEGEGLVFLTLTEQYLQQIAPNSNAYWARGSATAFSDNVKFYRTLTRDYLHQVALVIPPKGKGKIRILSIDNQLTNAGGS